MSCHLFIIKYRLYFLTFCQQGIEQQLQIQRTFFSRKVRPYHTVSMHGWLYKKRVIRRFIHTLLRKQQFIGNIYYRTVQQHLIPINHYHLVQQTVNIPYLMSIDTTTDFSSVIPEAITFRN